MRGSHFRCCRLLNGHAPLAEMQVNSAFRECAPVEAILGVDSADRSMTWKSPEAMDVQPVVSSGMSGGMITGADKRRTFELPDAPASADTPGTHTHSGAINNTRRSVRLQQRTLLTPSSCCDLKSAINHAIMVHVVDGTKVIVARL